MAEDEKREMLTTLFLVRFSNEEAQKIRAQARACYLPASRFLRQRILGLAPVSPPRPMSERPIDAAAFEQLRGIAANLNQLTRHANEGQTFGIGSRLLDALEALRGPVRELMVSLKVGQ